MIYNNKESIIGLANLEKATNLDVTLTFRLSKLVFKKLYGINPISRRIDKMESFKYLSEMSDFGYTGIRNVNYYFNKKENKEQYWQGWNKNYTVTEAARLILLDSLIPLDNDTTFDILNSINSNSRKVRDYYYPVFSYISFKSDGALSEVIGGYSLEYFNKYPKEFFQRHNKKDFKNITEFESVIGHIQYELAFLDNMQDSLTSLITVANQYSNQYQHSTSTFKLKINETKAAQ